MRSSVWDIQIHRWARKPSRLADGLTPEIRFPAQLLRPWLCGTTGEICGRIRGKNASYRCWENEWTSCVVYWLETFVAVRGCEGTVVAQCCYGMSKMCFLPRTSSADIRGVFWNSFWRPIGKILTVSAVLAKKMLPVAAHGAGAKFMWLMGRSNTAFLSLQSVLMFSVHSGVKFSYISLYFVRWWLSNN
jgi:hypothetical protein